MKRICLMLAALTLVISGCPNNSMLEAISVTPNKVISTVGELVVPNDIVVMATYNDGSTKTVTGFAITPATFSEAGTITVTVTYSENGVTKTASYEVTVNDPVPPTPPTPETFTVTFHANNDAATGNMEVQTFTEDVEQALTACGFSLNGYSFLGWAKAADAVDKEFDDAEIILVTEDMELYAVWEKITLQSILVTPVYTGDYIVGDTLTEDDITVTATYTDGSEKKVTGWTSDADFSSVASDKEITISYEEDGITATDILNVNIIGVNEFPTDAKTLPYGTDGTAGSEATYVEFGYWPQTIKRNDVKITESLNKKVGMFTYHAGRDGNWYCKALENAYGTDAQYKYSNNERVKQKSDNSSQWFKVEPIKWRVLTNNYNGKKLLFAEEGLYASIAYYDNTSDRIIYSKTIYANNYKHSKIRAWLNGLSYYKSGSVNSDYLNKGFLQTAFSSEDLQKIVTVDVDNSEESTNPNSNPKEWMNGANDYACEPTQDKIFLLSVKEASNSDYGFAEWNESLQEGARRRKPTDFALANYGQLDSLGQGCYFLRSPNCLSNDYAWYVASYGALRCSYLDNLYNDYPLVLPALCVE